MFRLSSIDWRAMSLCGLVLASTPALADEPACEAGDTAVAQAILPNVKQMLSQAITALDSGDATDQQRIKTWFGVTNTSDRQRIKQIYENSLGFVGGISFRCAVNTNATLGDVYAYVEADHSFAIVVSRFFFDAPDSGAFDSRPGVVVHEMSHFDLAGATKDNAYGVNEAQEIALANPHLAQNTADNYEYFAESIAFNVDPTRTRAKRSIRWYGRHKS